MRRRFLDTTVLAYAFGGSHTLREACQQILADRASGDVELHVSTEAVQEFLHHRLRRADRAPALRQAREISAFCVVHPFDAVVLNRSLALIATTPIRGRDAVHAATALEHDFTEIVSADPDFDDVPGLRRVDPADL